MPTTFERPGLRINGLWTSLPLISLLAACSTAPRPPSADEATRRPANQALTVDLQACKTDLHNTRLLASETARLAETSTAVMHQLALAKGGLAQLRPTLPEQAPTNTVYTLTFAADSTTPTLAPEELSALAKEAKAAALIVLRGRTDATADDAAHTHTARARAEAVRTALITAGIPPERIRTTWQGFGDIVASNDTPEGRTANRRVEVELYRTLPTLSRSTPLTTATAAATATATADIRIAP